MGLLFGAQLLGFEGAKQPDSLAGRPGSWSKLNADSVAVAPRGIEQNYEVTTKEGMLDETILNW
jgi:hypothetical protein